MRTASVALLLLLLNLAVIWLVADRLPAVVTTSREAVLPAPVERVFAVVTDVGAQPRWRDDVASITLAPDGTTWTETLRRGGTIRFARVQLVPQERFEITYTSPLGFSGRWIGTFSAPDAASTRLHIEETTTTPQPMRRLLARLFGPKESHVDIYLAALRRALPEPRRD